MSNPLVREDPKILENYKKLGRVACVKFDNPLDAMCILAGMVDLTLPLINGLNDKPVIITSQNFMEFLGNLDSNSNINFDNAGKLFQAQNKKITSITAEIKNLFMNGNDHQGKRGRRKRFRKKKGGGKQRN